jgi:hypothetical protein
MDLLLTHNCSVAGRKKIPITEFTQSLKMLLPLFPLSSQTGHSEHLNRLTPAVHLKQCQKSVLEDPFPCTLSPAPSYFLSTGGIL